MNFQVNIVPFFNVNPRNRFLGIALNFHHYLARLLNLLLSIENVLYCARGSKFVKCLILICIAQIPWKTRSSCVAEIALLTAQFRNIINFSYSFHSQSVVSNDDEWDDNEANIVERQCFCFCYQRKFHIEMSSVET